MLYVTTKAVFKIGAFAHKSYKMRRLFLIGFIIITSYDEYKRRKRFKHKNNDNELLEIL